MTGTRSPFQNTSRSSRRQERSSLASRSETSCHAAEHATAERTLVPRTGRSPLQPGRGSSGHAFGRSGASRSGDRGRIDEFGLQVGDAAVLEAQVGASGLQALVAACATDKNLVDEAAARVSVSEVPRDVRRAVIGTNARAPRGAGAQPGQGRRCLGAVGLGPIALP